jgi:hypothetical protein
MNTLNVHPSYNAIALENHTESIATRFINWSTNEQKNRIAWVGISIVVITAVFFPITMVSILIHGASFKLIIGAMFSLILVVVPNLAALPTRYTIPAFFTGVFIDIILIAFSFFI